ncbi:hypothetical protein ABB02_00795 [Clostridiaceae bacterium JG1575]|nr:hypothetical protein ABB02_00795 [Clostridiaceae bacterium JG1575]
MRAIMEPIFNILYLIVVLGLGIRTFTKAKDPSLKLYGLMAILLGSGDAFHLIPRILHYWANGSYESSMAFGKLVTSITMTLFYVILYEFLVRYYKKERTPLMQWGVYGLAVIRIALCLFPQNRWLSGGNYTWELLRNLPFALLGLLLIVYAKQVGKDSFRLLWLAILLSFGFYAPVVLWNHLNPNIGLLMIPKTIAYVWIAYMGYQEMRRKTPLT